MRIWGTQGVDDLKGTDGSDTIVGSAKNGNPLRDKGDGLSGLGGDDVLFGAGGNDGLYGGEGDDYSFGGNGRDAIIDSGGDNFLFGGPGRDGLFADRGSDKLYGGGGSDYLSGAGGVDRLWGGAGHDTFGFEAYYGTTRDKSFVADFENDIDTLSFSETLGVESAEEALELATIVRGNTVFTFGSGDIVVIRGVTDKALLLDDIAIV